MKRLVIGAVSLAAIVLAIAYSTNVAGWVLADTNLPSYSASPSGDTGQAQAQEPTVTPAPTEAPVVSEGSVCRSLTVTGGAGGYAPAEVSFSADAADGVQVYKYHFGNGEVEESSSSTVSHIYAKAGTFTAFVEVQDAEGNWSTSKGCEATVVVDNPPLAQDNSGCSEVVITGDFRPPPASVTHKVIGYDSAGPIQGYRVAYEQAGIDESETNNAFVKEYGQSGTYQVLGFIKNSQGVWVGGTGLCAQNAYISSGSHLTSQPETGVADLIWIVILGSLITGLVLWQLSFSKLKRN